MKFEMIFHNFYFKQDHKVLYVFQKAMKSFSRSREVTMRRSNDKFDWNKEPSKNYTGHLNIKGELKEEPNQKGSFLSPNSQYQDTNNRQIFDLNSQKGIQKLFDQMKKKKLLNTSQKIKDKVMEQRESQSEKVIPEKEESRILDITPNRKDDYNINIIQQESSFDEVSRNDQKAESPSQNNDGLKITYGNKKDKNTVQNQSKINFGHFDKELLKQYLIEEGVLSEQDIFKKKDDKNSNKKDLFKNEKIQNILPQKQDTSNNNKKQMNQNIKKQNSYQMEQQKNFNYLPQEQDDKFIDKNLQQIKRKVTEKFQDNKNVKQKNRGLSRDQNILNYTQKKNTEEEPQKINVMKYEKQSRDKQKNQTREISQERNILSYQKQSTNTSKEYPVQQKRQNIEDKFEKEEGQNRRKFDMKQQKRRDVSPQQKILSYQNQNKEKKNNKNSIAYINPFQQQDVSSNRKEKIQPQKNDKQFSPQQQILNYGKQKSYQSQNIQQNNKQFSIEQQNFKSYSNNASFKHKNSFENEPSFQYTQQQNQQQEGYSFGEDDQNNKGVYNNQRQFENQVDKKGYQENKIHQHKDILSQYKKKIIKIENNYSKYQLKKLPQIQIDKTKIIIKRKKKYKNPLSMQDMKKVFKQLSRHQKNKDEAEKEINIVQQQLEKSNQEIEMLKKEIELKNKELKYFDLQTNKNREENIELNNQIKDLKFQNRSYDIMYRQASEKIFDFKESNKKLTKNYDQLNNKLGQLINLVFQQQDPEMSKKKNKLIKVFPIQKK